MAMRLRAEGWDDFVVLDRADAVGGAWRDNTYPGASCDVPSNLYSFSFVPNPDWTRTFAPQQEIRRYLERCVARFGLGRHLRLGQEVRAASWDERTQRWLLDGPDPPLTADVLVCGTGPLSEPAVPVLPGLERFAGTIFHSARWDHGHDLSGRRVAVIGTGASTAQFVPRIQPDVRALHVFQRTPPWVVPRLDRRRGSVERWLYRKLPALQRLARSGVYWGREVLMVALAGEHGLLRIAEWLSRVQLRAQVRCPDMRRALTPDYTFGCKRPVLSNDYYPALCEPNAELVTSPIRELRRDAVVTVDGTLRRVDTIILGTGFHAANMPLAARLRGRDGRTLSGAWTSGAQAYLGTAVAGFPNLFLLAGPNSVLGHNSLILIIEQQVEYVLKALRFLDDHGLSAMEIRSEVQSAFTADLQRRMARTVWLTGCASWYLDAHGRNVTLWPSFVGTFRRLASRFDPGSYLLEPCAGDPARRRRERQ
jgi:cation diffusion facilitator CzcD-associated flavoprotein CzcO